MKNIPAKLNYILNNKTLGSSELAILLNEYFLSIKTNRDLINESIKLIKSRLGHFEVINSYLEELKIVLSKKSNESLPNFLRKYSDEEQQKIQDIFKKIFSKFKNINSVITLSRSKTVIEIFKLWHKQNKKLKVVICESRPKFEGRTAALELLKEGINVELITDAMMSIMISEVDAAIIGADSVLKNKNVINKVGSKSLSMLCKENQKPFYVITTKSKFSERKSFKAKKENSREVWDKSAKNLKVSNIYFEEVEKKFITKIFTD